MEIDLPMRDTWCFRAEHHVGVTFYGNSTAGEFVSKHVLRLHKLGNPIDCQTQGFRGHDKIRVTADLGLNLLVQSGRPGQSSQFFLGHFQIRRRLNRVIDRSDGQNEIVQITNDLTKIVVILGFVTMFQEGSYHPYMCDLGVDGTRSFQQLVATALLPGGLLIDHRTQVVGSSAFCGAVVVTAPVAWAPVA